MGLSDFIQGLQLLAPYFDETNGRHIDAEHDQFYVSATDRPLPVETVAQMIGLGWFQLNQSDDSYDPQENWSAFT